MLIYILGLAAVIYTVSLGFVGNQLYKVSIKSATEVSNATAIEFSNYALQTLSNYDGVGNVLSKSLSNVHMLDESERRNYVMSTLYGIMESNPDYLSVWSIWEPNSIDNLDSSYINKTGSTYIGSFSPGYVRDAGQILLEENNSTELFQGQYYKEVKASRSSKLMEPYYYSYSGLGTDSIFQTNLVMPIIIEGEFCGVVGIDIPVSYFQHKFGQLAPLETGHVYLLSNKGVVVTAPDSALIGESFSQIISEYENDSVVFENIKNGEVFGLSTYNEESDENSFMSFYPIVIGHIHAPWSFCVSIPQSTIYSQSRKSLGNIVLVGLFGLFILSITIGFFARSISSPIKQITKSLQDLASGNISKDGMLKYSVNDEVGDLATSVNGLFEGLNSAAEFAGQIGKGNLQAEYKLLSHSDELGNSLLAMQKSLQIAKEEEEKKKVIDANRIWITHGLAHFGEIIRKDNDDMIKFSTNLVKELASYLKVAQVGIFIGEKDNYEDSEESFVLKAAMAYGKLVMLERRVSRGNELIGRAIEDNRMIHLVKLPQNYVEISPGLKSESRPDNLIISPLTINETAFGVIELVSYDEFSPHHIEFIEKLSENIASVISSVSTNMQTAELLEQSQHQADELAQHEEEMRQNLEEMQATQEEAFKREGDLSSFINTIHKSFMVAELDLTGRVLDMSPAMVMAYGISIDNVKGKFYDAFVAQDEVTRNEFNIFWEDLLRNGKGKRSYTIDNRNKHQVYSEEYLVLEQEGMLPKVLIISLDRTKEYDLSVELENAKKANSNN